MVLPNNQHCIPDFHFIPGFHSVAKPNPICFSSNSTLYMKKRIKDSTLFYLQGTFIIREISFFVSKHDSTLTSNFIVSSGHKLFKDFCKFPES